MAPTKAQSATISTPVVTAMRPTLQRQRRRASAMNSTVVMAMVADTARPKAAARLADVRKPSTTAMVASMSSQFSVGM